MGFRYFLNACKSVVVVLTVVIFNTAQAQQFSARVNGGLTASQISGDGAYGFVQFGAMIGGEVGLAFNDEWSSSFGIRFNQKGSRIYKSNNSINTYRLRVNFIEAPLLLQYSLQKLTFAAGPVLGVMINQKERTQFGQIENLRAFDPFELGFEFNIGYEIKEGLRLRLLYQNSILAVRDHSIDQAFPPANFVLGSLHQKMLDQGQYFTSLSLVVCYEF
jgi:hypothetical protein